jgi:hypothetical protein
LGLTLGACTQFPDLDGTVAPDLAGADFPALVPLGPLLASAVPTGAADTAQTTQDLQSRIAALRARAQALQRRPVLDDGSQSRLSDDVS